MNPTIPRRRRSPRSFPRRSRPRARAVEPENNATKAERTSTICIVGRRSPATFTNSVMTEKNSALAAM